MTEKERLLKTLFDNKEARHLNIKFCRGSSDDISAEEFCREINNIFLQVKTGLIEADQSLEEDFKQIDVSNLRETL